MVTGADGTLLFGEQLLARGLQSQAAGIHGVHNRRLAFLRVANYSDPFEVDKDRSLIGLHVAQDHPPLDISKALSKNNNRM